MTKRLAYDQFEAELLAGGGDAIAGAGANKALRDVPRLVAEHGGNMEGMLRTGQNDLKSFEAADGSVIAAHAYKNVASGKVVEVKGIVDKYPYK